MPYFRGFAPFLAEKRLEKGAPDAGLGLFVLDLRDHDHVDFKPESLRAAVDIPGKFPLETMQFTVYFKIPRNRFLTIETVILRIGHVHILG